MPKIYFLYSIDNNYINITVNIVANELEKIMKTTLLILNLNDWEYQGKNGTSARFLLEKADKVISSTLNDELIKQVKAVNLPALFEADIEVSMTNYDNKPGLKYSLSSLKMIRYTPLFSK